MKRKDPLLLEVLAIVFFALFFVLLAARGSEGDFITRDISFEKQKLQTLKCESSYRHDGVWGDGGRAYGIAQFHKGTFNWLKTEAGWPQLRWESKKDQLWLFDWALRNGYAYLWTCARCLPAKTKTKAAFKLAVDDHFKPSSKYCKPCNFADKSAKSGVSHVKAKPAPEVKNISDAPVSTGNIWTPEVDTLYDYSMVDV